MAIYENLTHFAGRPVQDWNPALGIADPKGVAYRVGVSYEDAEKQISWSEKFTNLLTDPCAGQVEALIVGAWENVAGGQSSASIVEALAGARKRLAGLRHLFFGDITMEESEISWILHGDLSPLFEAFPNLTHLTIRGGSSLSLGTPHHANLEELVIQTGGLPAPVLHEIAAAELPALRHLELWLGTPNYGGVGTAEDIPQLLKGTCLSRLSYLGLKNSDVHDDIATLLAVDPLTARLETLDLSMGTLSDVGARALLQSPYIRHLKKLDIHHHYISDELVAQLQSLGIEVDAGGKQEADVDHGEEHRYVEVSE